ncbi:unnamed protein product [Ostreobium quekettii]|uniref:Uncharacterized protein n=1 Tax=Ostreobium quekettii TaxID=121088 RepID=A0A8S1IR07_9CHLO|nr:unnamed protein product [Ostreobium quekettii]
METGDEDAWGSDPSDLKQSPKFASVPGTPGTPGTPVVIEQGTAMGHQEVVAPKPLPESRVRWPNVPCVGDEDVYIFVNFCGLRARLNATPKKVSQDFASLTRTSSGSMWKALLIWPLALLAAFSPYLIPLRNHEGGYRRNWQHFALMMPITQMLILSSVPELAQAVGGIQLTVLEQALTVLIGTMFATLPVMVVGGLGTYPLRFTPILCTIPASWLVFLLLFLIGRPQFQDGSSKLKHFVVAIHVHNMFYIGGTVVLLYTMGFRSWGPTAQRFSTLLIPATRISVRKLMEVVLANVSTDLIPSAIFLAEFSIQSLVASILPGLPSLTTVLMVVGADLLSNFFHVFTMTPTFLRLRFWALRTLGGGRRDPNASNGCCSPLIRSSMPAYVTFGTIWEDPQGRQRRLIYKAGQLMSLELADVAAPLVWMAFATGIHALGYNNDHFGLGPGLKPLTGYDIMSGWQWSGILSGAEAVTAMAVIVAMGHYTQVSGVSLVKRVLVDNTGFLARMIFSKYIYIFSLLLMHSGVVDYI